MFEKRPFWLEGVCFDLKKVSACHEDAMKMDMKERIKRKNEVVDCPKRLSKDKISPQFWQKSGSGGSWKIVKTIVY